MSSLIRLAAPGLALLGSLLTWPLMPDPMPIHWGIDGRPDGFAPRAVGLLLLPLVALLLPSGLAWLARRDTGLGPRARGGLERVLAGTAAFLSALHALALGAAAGDGVLALAWVTGLLGALFVLVGASLRDIEPNRWMGVRTAATLRDRAIWDVVHRHTSRAFVVVGVATVLAALALPSSVALGIAIGGSLVVGLGSMAFAWALGRARPGA